MWSLAPLLSSSIDTIKNEFAKIITLFVLAILLAGKEINDSVEGLGFRAIFNGWKSA
jgi:hypothetical protein